MRYRLVDVFHFVSHFVFARSLAISDASPHSSQPDPAWNGQLLPGVVTSEANNVPFLPYYVPAGDQSIDDASSAVEYSPGFVSQHDLHFIGGTQHISHVPSSTVTLRFFGGRVECFGQTSPHHGQGNVFVDGHLVAIIDAYSPKLYNQQRILNLDGLKRAHHTLRIIFTGSSHPTVSGPFLSIDAFVVGPQTDHQARDLPRPTASGSWRLTREGTTGVAAMQLAVVSDKHAVIIDKVEHNPLSISGHPAWGALYDLEKNTIMPLDLLSNSFCAGGSWLSNGTLLNVGGNPVVADKTGAADFGDFNGLQSVRMLHPCDSGECNIYEEPNRIRLATPRWYNSVTRLEDGSVMIIGGSFRGGWMNNRTTNNPTIEYWPPKNLHGQNGLPIRLQFLIRTLNANLFPIAFTLPDGRVFLAANRDAIIYDWKKNTELQLPKIPNRVQVMICGGSNIDDTRPSYEISSSELASNQCSRIALSESGIKNGWTVEYMPVPRIMPDAVTLPDGKILILNGARSGIAGYGNVKGRMGQSNAANPVFQSILYDPTAPIGQRFSSSGIPPSGIPRLYHSVASLTPSGAIMIAGSNPNLDRSNAEYGTEYRVEWLYPPYTAAKRPIYTGVPSKLGYGKSFVLHLPNVEKFRSADVALMDLGFVTHGLHMNARLVYLKCSVVAKDSRVLQVYGPSSAGLYPPGPAWLYVLIDGIPSVGKKVMVGDGEGPPVDQAAIDNMLAKTTVVDKLHPPMGSTSER
ncbi:putative copper radical oxidase [Cantharellus anzutake]|uniref:putative copper radical oxidase n=1 Tax=Cantharellus anzutake TaxID=1750568 RepID=UPI001903775A|nr:putative copper radical oxidase [Cantharellus anzutake]KAF8333942.1 putative copper radical oxidase [Cantharellus anzutake]